MRRAFHHPTPLRSIALASVFLLVAAGRPRGASAVEPDRYAFDAAGRDARVDETWELRLAGDRTLDLFVGLARCPSAVFLSDGQSRIYRLDLTTKGVLGVLADEDAGLGKPAALAADCEGDKLYVVNEGLRTVVTLNARSGAMLGKQSFKRDLFTSRSVNLAGSDVAYLGGLWNPEPSRGLPTFSAETFFEPLWIGEKVSLASGTVEGALRPYETRCTAAAACVYADLDRVRTSTATTWVASQGTSVHIAIYDAQGNRTNLYDIRSPKFLRDGTELAMSSSSEAAERWKGRNSIIRRVFAIANYLVTVHTLTDIGPDWTFGQPSQFKVFMNIHSLDGKGLVSDVRLPDLPIGRDDTHLYAIDYGPSGRQKGLSSVKLVRIPINTGANSVARVKGGPS